MNIYDDMLKGIILLIKTDASSACLRAPSDSGKEETPSKRPRPIELNEFQVSELRKRYKIDPHINGVEKAMLSKYLGISPHRIAIWFAKQRSKGKMESRQQ